MYVVSNGLAFFPDKYPLLVWYTSREHHQYTSSYQPPYPGPTQDTFGWTALNIASLHGQKQVVTLLLEAQGNVKLGTSSGQTPLTSAAQLGFADIVKTLLQHGADLRMVTSKGRTALHLAADNGHVQVERRGGRLTVLSRGLAARTLPA